MRRNPKFVRLMLAAFGLALALPAAMTVTSRIAHASGWIFASGAPCNPSPENPDCIDNGDGQ